MEKRVIISFAFILFLLNFASATSSSCIGDNCTLYEGATLTVYDNDVSIAFISDTVAKLTVEGENTNSLEVGDYFENSEIKITITEIHFAGYVGELFYIKFKVEQKEVSECDSNICTLYVGDKVTHKGYNFEINFISGTEVKLNVDGINLNYLSVGNTIIHKDIKIIINKINFHNEVVGGGLSSVKFTIEPQMISTCDENSCILYEGQKVSPKSLNTGIAFIDADEVKLKIDGDTTSRLSVDESYEQDDVKFIIKDINYVSTEGALSSVEFEYEDVSTYPSTCSGNICTLYENGEVNPNSHKTKIQFIDSEGVSLNVDNQITNHLTKGYTYSNDDTKFTIKEFMFSSKADTLSYVKFQYENIPKKNSSCSDNSCTLYEGQKVNQEGYNFEIAFISDNKLKLKVDEANLDYLAIGDTIVYENRKIKINEIFFTRFPGDLSYVKFTIEPVFTSSCSEGACTLYENQEVTHNLGGKSYLVKLDFISSNEVVFNVNGQPTNKISEGDYLLIEEVNIFVDEIMFSSKGGEINGVKFNMNYVGSCNGCLLEEKCFPFGYRKNGEYCAEDSEFTSQLIESSVCENNFECESNVCIDGTCIDGNLIQKVINWFKKIFGGE